MITNFEEITAELSDEEKRLIRPLIKGFSGRTKDNSIKEPEIIKAINDRASQYGLKKKLTGARLRKIVNFLRAKSILPIIATTKGYFVSYDLEEIAKQKKSMEERAAAILVAAAGMANFLNKNTLVKSS